MLLTALVFIVAQPLTIRRAQVDISPPEPLPLGGYTERHGKVMDVGGDPLYARCIELEQGGTKVAIVSVECLTIPESLYREVSKRIPQDVHLFMQATHTHCAPDSQMLNDRMTFSIPGIATYRKRWLTWYADKIASTVSEALSQPSKEIPELDARTAIVAANRARRKGGKADPTLTEIAAPDGLLFTHFTAHPTIYDENQNQTRGDWPGLLAARSGAMVLNGAIGDVSPAADGPTPADKFAAFERELSETDKATRFQVWAQNSPGLSWDSETIRLDPKKPHPTFAKTYKIPQGLAQSLVNQFAPPADGISALRVGSLAIIGVPGEPTSVLGNQIKAAGLRMGFKSVLVCSHVNGWMGYILDPKDYDRGGYEAELSFYGRQEGKKVVDAAVAALRKLKAAH